MDVNNSMSYISNQNIISTKDLNITKKLFKLKVKTEKKKIEKTNILGNLIKNIKKIQKYFLFILFFFIFIILLFGILIYIPNIINENYLEKENEKNDENDKNDKNDKNNISYNITNLEYKFSFLYNIVELQYDINLFDENKTLIKPSDLYLVHYLHFFCYIKYNNSNNSGLIYSYPNIIQNKDFNCIEYFNLNETIEVGIIIYKNNNKKLKSIFLFTNKNIDYDNLINENNDKFNPEIINNEYNILNNEIKKNLEQNTKTNKPLLLISSFIKEPNCLTKKRIIKEKGHWYFFNIYNNYFCFCESSKCLHHINQDCKYYFYLTIIDKNRDLYNKTDYLLADFFSAKKSADDTFPVFKELLRQNYSAHYMTEKENIYKEFCGEEKICKKIIMIENGNRNIDGDFLEKNLEMILRLKMTLAGTRFNSKTLIFYNIEYITSVTFGHGIPFFKLYLYDKYQSWKRYNKILLPQSDIIINIAKKHGWKDENIIKNGLPRWDKYIEYEENIKKGIISRKRCIFLMFTWRQIKPGRRISKYYLDNFLKLINNNKLIRALYHFKIIMYFALHHTIKYKVKNERKNIILKLINQDDISTVLTKSNLIISDFSSVIFELIYRRKPFIMFIPDAYDPDIKNLYSQSYFDIINGLKNNSIQFENKIYDVESVVDKIIYYFKNNFNLDNNLIKLYDKFGLNTTNNTMTFVEKIKNIK